MVVQAPTFKNIELQHGSLAAFFAWLEADIICFQETKLIAGSVPHSMQHVDGFESFWTCSSAKKGYSGCATFVRLPCAARDASDDSELSGTMLLLLRSLCAQLVMTQRGCA